MTIIERIQQIADHQGLSIRAFEISINASNGLIRHALNKNTDIQSKWITAIADNYPHINIEWLVTGRGEMLRDTISMPSTEIIAQSEPYEVNEIILLKEFLKEEKFKVDSLNQEIGRLKERLAVFTVRKEQIKDVEDADVAAVG